VSAVDTRDFESWRKKLRDAQIQIEELQRRNEVLEEQLLLVGNRKVADKGDMVKVKPGGAKCLVLCDSLIRSVGAGKTNMKAEFFSGNYSCPAAWNNENINIGCAYTVVIHVGTNDVRRSTNLDYVMGQVYDLVNTAKAKFPSSRLVLSGVLRCNGVSWWLVGAMNDRLEWVARNLGAIFVDNLTWIFYCNKQITFKRLRANVWGAPRP
jgi:hypothetical protein